ncbi:hypothetical protein [Cupriavidus alkaliphilus]|uniref:hypothetical protein n=1 Tax=Cupriavidus alkaliphilus TaxID=942866 RepID=UPI001620B277|nr:hypothetical protein [Cupriavidus alkaliphilus]MBB3012033.1 hypothetical protein [Cupriavidus alkaliphilus]
MQQLAVFLLEADAHALACQRHAHGFLNNSGHRLTFAEFCQLFDVLELDVVAPGDDSMVCLPREEYQALRTLARKGLEVA